MLPYEMICLDLGWKVNNDHCIPLLRKSYAVLTCKSFDGIID